MIHRYLGREIARTLVIVAPALCSLVALLQVMRLLPLVAAAGLGADDVLTVSLALLVPLSAVGLPAAAVISLLVVTARLEADGELLALRAAGASSARMALAPAALCLIVALGAGALTLFAEPAAARTLQSRLNTLLVRASLGRIRDGLVVEPAPGLTVFAQRRRGNQLEGLFLEDRRQAPALQLFATKARVMPAGNRAALQLILENGEIQGRTVRGRRLRATFRRLETTLALPGATEALASVVPRRLGRDPWQLARDARGGEDSEAAALLLHRRLALAPGALGLCLLTLMIGLRGRITAHPWAVTIGAGLVLAYHLVARIAEALVEVDLLGRIGGGWAPVVLTWTALGVMLLLRSPGRVWLRMKKPTLNK